MLLDPFEKQFDLPAAAIQLGDSQSRQCEIVGEKHQAFAGRRIFEANWTKRCVEILLGVKARQHNGLIANQTRASVDGVRIAALGFEIGLGSGDKEALRFVQLTKPIEVDVASIHDVESAGLRLLEIQNVDVVPFAIADVEKRRDVATQVQERVQRNSRFGRTKRRPRKHRQTQVDGAGIQSVDRVVEIDTERFASIETTGDTDERLSEVGVDAPVAALVGIGQSAARNLAVDPHVVEVALLGTQTRFDIAQTLSIGQLGRCHAEVLIETIKALDLVRSAKACHATPKRSQWPMSGDLCEHQLAGAHRDPLRVCSPQDGKRSPPNSNRDQAKS